MTHIIAKSGHSFNGALVGAVLGDATLFRRTPTATTCLTMGHLLEHRDYLEWKREYMRSYLPGGEIIERDRLDPRTQKIYYRCDWWSNVHKRLNYHHQDFYVNGKKIAKRQVLNRLTPLGLALWYLDDGHLRIRDGKLKEINLATNDFDERSRTEIINWFRDMLGLEFHPASGGEIWCSTRSAWRFLAIVKPMVDRIPSLCYKADIERITQRGRTPELLPLVLQKRLTGEENEIYDRGYVHQFFGREILFPLVRCKQCNLEFRAEYDTAYCSPRCRWQFNESRIKTEPKQKKFA